MQVALAIANVTATVKHPSMEGEKLLLVQPLAADGESPDGDPQLAVDRLGANRGMLVILTSDGRYIREILTSSNSPVRWSVIGIPDS